VDCVGSEAFCSSARATTAAVGEATMSAYLKLDKDGSLLFQQGNRWHLVGTLDDRLRIELTLSRTLSGILTILEIEDQMFAFQDNRR
jgi:hypothetical protein